MKLRSWAGSHRGIVGVTALSAAVVLGLAVYWFAPQNLFVDRRVDEALPGLEDGSVAGLGDDGGGGSELGQSSAGGGPNTRSERSSESTGPVVVSRGSLDSLEHATSGSALIVRLEDGSHVVRLEDLDTSNGPDLRVILSDRPVSDDWHGWTDGRHVDLGGLEGNVGSSNYEIPRDVDPSDFRTVVVWCRRFTVGFAVAPIELL